jgi:hypothetical protein
MLILKVGKIYVTTVLSSRDAEAPWCSKTSKDGGGVGEDERLTTYEEKKVTRHVTPRSRRPKDPTALVGLELLTMTLKVPSHS